MLIKQMSVFVENTTGRLAQLTRVLGNDGIDIKASCIADTVDFGILRCIVDDPEEATRVLKEHGFTASITEVIAVELEDRPGGFADVLEILAKENIGVNYIYSTIRSKEGAAIIVLKVEDPQKAIDVLLSNNVKLYKAHELGNIGK
ncbi:hypothetical protein [Zhenpiania hominis]|jgi:hypothetical protein|uniref:ACT domain-containing protein n=1 Tax=Zhenpiania hominis TaxID=2763644 RepID=A0A923NMD9_9FIRM|nr:hypothetical protein [Zhenpiania hominis]MBC6680610.1 hypothetical protein [Zhenpiania hominis]